jgi:hypothetical protein
MLLLLFTENHNIVVVVAVSGVPFIPNFLTVSQLIQTLEWKGTQRVW